MGSGLAFCTGDLAARTGLHYMKVSRTGRRERMKPRNKTCPPDYVGVSQIRSPVRNPLFHDAAAQIHGQSLSPS